MILPTGIKRVIVTGSRDWTDREVVVRSLLAVERRAAVGHRLTLIHGGQRGADAYAHSWARNRSGWITEVHPADWTLYGRAAGPVRNKAMIAAGADLVIAFPLGEAKGTGGLVALAEAAGIPVWTPGAVDWMAK